VIVALVAKKSGFSDMPRFSSTTAWRVLKASDLPIGPPEAPPPEEEKDAKDWLTPWVSYLRVRRQGGKVSFVFLDSDEREERR
jgi:hypothetical protein